MAPLDPGNTDRYFFHYENAAGQHTAVVRTAAGVAAATVIDTFESYCTEVGAGLSASTGVSVEFRAAGASFSSPVAVGDWVGFTFGSTDGNPYTDSVQVNAVGRSAGGHRCRLGLFGWKNDVSAWRLTGSEEGGIAESATAILNAATNIFLAIDGTKPTWYGYLDIKPNDYWVRKAR
jgi:hypothetical protein